LDLNSWDYYPRLLRLRYPRSLLAIRLKFYTLSRFRRFRIFKSYQNRFKNQSPVDWSPKLAALTWAITANIGIAIQNCVLVQPGYMLPSEWLLASTLSVQVLLSD
jgi:hypothetical protein